MERILKPRAPCNPMRTAFMDANVRELAQIREDDGTAAANVAKAGSVLGACIDYHYWKFMDTAPPLPPSANFDFDFIVPLHKGGGAKQHDKH